MLACASLGADEAADAERAITARDRLHWAFRPLAAGGAPPVRAGADARNPIDAFVERGLAAAGLQALGEADRATLLRRVTFDLIGLPPTTESVDAFLSDPSPDAFERLVDRLLAMPAHGERWGQHWLDLARFAESDGFEHDEARPEAWRYRDWVIEAVNDDLPWDVFVRWQLAGDILRPRDAGAVLATGFALCGPDMPDINLQDERRHMVLNDMTAAVGEVFLALQFGCAQCHDHKSDPVSQADFYRLRAFFDNVDIFKDHALPAASESATPEAVPAPEVEAAAAGAGAAAKRARPAGPRGRVLREGASPAKASHVRVRGDFRQIGPRVEAAFPRIALPPDGAVEDDAGDAPRVALARWLTGGDVPLAQRAVANRIWHYHFGDGLSRTPSDFGRLGDAPAHAELLDWLAAWLPRESWSVKRMHRLIATSAVYRRASHPRTDAERAAAGRAAAADPEGRLLALRVPRRLEAEAIRDALLAVSGRLSLRAGGPGVMAPLPQEIRNSIRKDHWKVSPDPEDHVRRSIYLFVRRNLRYPLLEVFDRPDTNASCSRRDRTTIAPQALALLNSDVAVGAAADLARRSASIEDTRSRIDLAHRLALGRRPAAAELAILEEFLRAESRRLEGGAASAGAAGEAAFHALCLALINTNEFIYVD